MSDVVVTLSMQSIRLLLHRINRIQIKADKGGLLRRADSRDGVCKIKSPISSADNICRSAHQYRIKPFTTLVTTYVLMVTAQYTGLLCPHV